MILAVNMKYNVGDRVSAWITTQVRPGYSATACVNGTVVRVTKTTATVKFDSGAVVSKIREKDILPPSTIGPRDPRYETPALPRVVIDDVEYEVMSAEEARITGLSRPVYKSINGNYHVDLNGRRWYPQSDGTWISKA